ncbi:LysM peptidoglycan-binding domain-containing protein [Oceanirhabdus seepicola]|uniref:LysM peptidoglycan-binding domain-containing protein n=1 Tax=Oceanirhabdus seepicola TaxID=2828781 RepID=A0A9J6P7B4_9CLOT|nr:LysM peptidoglycan-binding domain-containing protein [Oceanirhabdus seepicola]MCM1992022.1 LysM peptidoglycan-binding domain-containing protein [Oceanirhabdus seepicola]
MKYKNQLIVGSSILVIILAVFLGARLIGNATQEDSTLGNGMINNEISDIADDGIIDHDKVDEDKNIENTDKDTKEDEKIEKTNEEEDTTSKIDDKENIDETNKDVDEKEKRDDTDKKLDENKTDETNKEADDKNEIKDEKTSKSEDKDGKTIDETKDGNKELDQSKGENVVYVFKNKYIVQPKETLSDITKKCLIANKLDESNNIYFEHAKKLISKVNNVSDPNLIITGSKMIIPTKANFEGLLPKGEEYTVKNGDTLHSIVINEMSWCEYFKAKELLMKNNNITNENSIQSGITIYIPDENGEV